MCVVTAPDLTVLTSASPSAQALDKMQKEWETAELIVLEYRETKTFVVKVEEQISQMLDDHIVMTQVRIQGCSWTVRGLPRFKTTGKACVAGRQWHVTVMLCRILTWH